MEREYCYPTPAEAQRLAKDWGRLRGVRDGTLRIRLVIRTAE